MIGADYIGVFNVKEVMFELEYTCAVTGERVIRDVSSFDTACQIAKVLAKASGRRTMIRRKPKADRMWTVFMADVQTGTVDVAKDQMSKRRAMMLVRAWKAREKECVLFAWPDWAPRFRMEIVRSVA